MSADPTARAGLSLEEFLRLPEIDESPSLEYVDGRIERKAVPQSKHGRIQAKLTERLNAVAEPAGLGYAFPELRCTFAGRSIVPDVVYLEADHIEVDVEGVLVNETLRPPDIHVEIISPDQSVSTSHKKLLHSTANGARLGILIHPERKSIDVYRPNRPPERLADDGAIDFDPVLPGLRLPVAEVFSWLFFRRPGPIDPGTGPA